MDSSDVNPHSTGKRLFLKNRSFFVNSSKLGCRCNLRRSLCESKFLAKWKTSISVQGKYTK
uniref:Uncharacterized protein n=1 Tax=Lepeophtheirus salmonis TaxID=72036 RepID=A0A0K2U0F6_LEPSM